MVQGNLQINMIGVLSALWRAMKAKNEPLNRDREIVLFQKCHEISGHFLDALHGKQIQTIDQKFNQSLTDFKATDFKSAHDFCRFFNHLAALSQNPDRLIDLGFLNAHDDVSFDLLMVRLNKEIDTDFDARSFSFKQNLRRIAILNRRESNLKMPTYKMLP